MAKSQEGESYVPRGLGIRDIPDDEITSIYRLDTLVPQPQRARWPSDAPDDPEMYGFGDDD
jgi:hypothetical protein